MVIVVVVAMVWDCGGVCGVGDCRDGVGLWWCVGVLEVYSCGWVRRLWLWLWFWWCLWLWLWRCLCGVVVVVVVVVWGCGDGGGGVGLWQLWWCLSWQLW